MVLSIAFKSFLILGALWCVYRFAKIPRANHRHALLQLGFYLLLLLPLLSITLPKWEIIPTEIDTYITSPTILPKQILSTNPTVKKKETCVAANETLDVGHILTSIKSETNFLSSFLSILTFLFWGISLFFTGQLLWEQLLLYQIKSSGATVEYAKITRVWTTIRRKFDHPKRLQILIHANFSVPFTFGYFHPVIVLPKEVKDWNENQIQMVILHELAHIQRKDYLHNLIRQVGRIFYWWNPFFWILNRYAQLESEKATDEWVLLHDICALDYAKQLVQLTRQIRQRRFRTAVAMSASKDLQNRIVAILGNSEATEQDMTIGYKSVFFLIILGLFTISCLELESPTSEFSRAFREIKPQETDKLKKLIWQVGEKESSQSLPDITPFLQHEDPGIRSLTAWALGEIKSSTSFYDLLPLLEDENELVIEMAIRSLGELEIAEAIPYITPFLQHSNSGFNLAATQALADIGSPEGLEQLSHTLAIWPSEKQEKAIQLIGDNGKVNAVSLLVEIAKDNQHVNQREAIIALGNLHTRDAIPILMTLLKTSSPSIRRESARALGKIGDASALECLLPALSDPAIEVRDMVVWALDEIRG